MVGLSLLGVILCKGIYRVVLRLSRVTGCLCFFVDEGKRKVMFGLFRFFYGCSIENRLDSFIGVYFVYGEDRGLLEIFRMLEWFFFLEFYGISYLGRWGGVGRVLKFKVVGEEFIFFYGLLL